jgi:hypothetical protein
VYTLTLRHLHNPAYFYFSFLWLAGISTLALGNRRRMKSEAVPYPNG